MNKLDFIKSQIRETRLMTEQLMNNIPDHLWYKTPASSSSNLAWQIGHLIISEIRNTIEPIGGDLTKIAKDIPLRDYLSKYGPGSDAEIRLLHAPSVALLRKQFKMVHDLLMETIDQLTEEDLNKSLPLTAFPHPTAHTIQGALLWNIKHEMWHCGEIALLKRMAVRLEDQKNMELEQDLQTMNKIPMAMTK